MIRIAYLALGIFGLLLNYSFEGLPSQYHFPFYHNLPNFLSVFITTFLLNAWYQQYQLKNVTGATIGLVCYEFIQLNIPSRTFDVMDIVASLFGMLVYITVYFLINTAVTHIKCPSGVS
tara:strand:+ start:540 stop:896 length:357 start_codon:yes stop_codon:yes gene_type:complete